MSFDPSNYLIQPSTGHLFIAPAGDVLRERADLREPTQAELDAHYAAINGPVVAEDEIISVEADSPAEPEKRRGRPPKAIEPAAE